jgi:hypothetical protein
MSSPILSWSEGVKEGRKQELETNIATCFREVLIGNMDVRSLELPSHSGDKYKVELRGSSAAKLLSANGRGRSQPVQKKFGGFARNENSKESF